jgi:hypothetical protein
VAPCSDLLERVACVFFCSEVCRLCDSKRAKTIVKQIWETWTGWAVFFDFTLTSEYNDGDGDG